MRIDELLRGGPVMESDRTARENSSIRGSPLASSPVTDALFRRPGAIFVPVPDLEKARDWYVDALGFVSVGHWPAWGVSDVALPESPTALGLTDRAPGRTLGWLCEETRTPHANLLVRDAHAVHARLTELGLEVGPLEPFEDAYSWWFVDPYGNVFGVASIEVD